MSTTTTTYGFATPTPGTEEDNWGALWNDTADDIDDLLDGTTQVECIRWQTATLGSDALDADSGNIRRYSVSTNTTFSDSLAEGDWLLLHLTVSSSPTINWPTMTWVGSDEPSLSNAEHVIGLWKQNSTLYAKYGGVA